MVDYREILRLGSNPKNSQRSIAVITHSSRNTVHDVLLAASKAGISWPLEDSVANDVLGGILFPDKPSDFLPHVMPDFPFIHKELARPGVNLTLLWSEYCEKCKANGKIPYKYTQFCEKYRQWARVTKATMRIQHKPGDAMEVDWAGNTLDITDHVTGEISKAYLFIAVLPCSGFAYAELCADMKLDSWLMCHVHAYNYFGGTTRLLIVDNLKTGVKSNTRYETVLNKSYQEMAEYYGTAVVPARVAHPKDKSHAEGTVRLASTWILAALRNRRFLSFEDGRSAVAQKLEELNDRPFTKRDGCRRSAFITEEQEFLRPLPGTPYEIAAWSPEMKVGVDYLVSDGLNKYSVPFDLIGERVSLRITKETVEAFFHGTRVALHIRERAAGRAPIVNPDHMPPEHRKFLSYNASDFVSWAESVGEGTKAVVQWFLAKDKEPEQGFKSCASLMKLGSRYGIDRLENACSYLLSFTASPSIRTLSAVLKNGRDRLQQQKDTSAEQSGQHGITRGADYFRKGGVSHD